MDKNILTKLILSILSLFILGVVGKFFFTCTVYESQKALKTEFGKVVNDANGDPLVFDSGIYFQMPIKDNFEIIEDRQLTTYVDNERFVTIESKDLLIDYYVIWKIKDHAKYYLATKGGVRDAAEGIILRKITSIMKENVGRHKILEVSTGTVESFVKNNDEKDIVNPAPERSAITLENGKREKILSEVKRSASKAIMESLGVELIAVRYRSIELPSTILESMYKRIIAERKASAITIRAKGEKNADKLKSTAYKESLKMLAITDQEVISIKGLADANVSKIYSDAFEKDPDFYYFYKSLSSYSNALTNQNGSGELRNPALFMFDFESDYFRVMKRGPKDH